MSTGREIHGASWLFVTEFLEMLSSFQRIASWNASVVFRTVFLAFKPLSDVSYSKSRDLLTVLFLNYAIFTIFLCFIIAHEDNSMLLHTLHALPARSYPIYKRP